MADYYAGTYQEVMRFIGQMLSIGTGMADTLRPEDIEKFMSDTDEEINSILNGVYFTPLKKLPNGKYPDPIPFIAKVLTAAQVIQVYYKEIKPNESESIKKMQEEAYFRLNRIVNGTISYGSSRLEGQRIKARNRFTSPTIGPSQPPTPTTGPSGGVGTV